MRAAGSAPMRSAKSASEDPARTRTTVDPSPRGTSTPATIGDAWDSHSSRFARLDLRLREGRPPCRPKAPAVDPPRDLPPERVKPPAGPLPGLPPRPGPPPRPPLRLLRLGAWALDLSGIMLGLGRGAPERGRGPPPCWRPEPPCRGMPWEVAKGLLPGRGAPGLGPRPGRGGLGFLSRRPDFAAGADGLGAVGRGAVGTGALRPFFCSAERGLPSECADLSEAFLSFLSDAFDPPLAAGPGAGLAAAAPGVAGLGAGREGLSARASAPSWPFAAPRPARDCGAERRSPPSREDLACPRSAGFFFFFFSISSG